ncbi:MAG: N-acetylmuramoyl-L-alanine amidase [Deltaproteobacteria bacterium]|nr:N-acetylmuramoyl-L-alanine amidase [Deltaproteobacteria bacterium]MDQ3295582.1 N-acetylmuramoyl-L-alanine amidase [Myxococcota bacterium]
MLRLPAALGLLGLLATATAADAAPRVVVLDPGHGGSNTGAKGVALHEKQLTLVIAKLVAERLRAKAVAVRLTRDDDRTLTLRQRVAIADRVPADLFVSIHANASLARNQRGYETFILTPRGLDVDGRALRADVATTRPGVDPEIVAILDDIERGSSQWEAADLAARIQRALRERRGATGDRGVRQDAHHVLLGATMPAVLVEIGFLDHPIEGKQLATSEVQSQIADAIAEAILEQLAE